MNNRFRVFLDFDGTITENDVGYEMFKKFTCLATEPLVQAYRRGEINSRVCLAGECDIWNASSPDPAEVDAFLKCQPLRGGLDTFLAFLLTRGLQPLILSEGFDFYIDRILLAHNLSHLKRFCNVARYSDGKLVAEFPYFGLGCRNCSNCKGYHIQNERPFNTAAIYIGDGHSDLHASLAADTVFARSHLAEIMEEEGKPYIAYEDFHDIQRQVETILTHAIFAQTQRLDFCFVSDRHLPAIQRLWEDGEVMKYVGYPDGLGKNQAYYDSLLPKLAANDSGIYLAMEDKLGGYIGEARIASPDKEGFCDHDLKLLSFCQGRGFGFEAWNLLLERARVRWPQGIPRVSPNIENSGAIALYLKLGFQFDGEIRTWTPPEAQTNAVPVRYRTMIKR